MSPRGRGWDAGAGRGWWGLPGLRARSCQARLVPNARGHSSRTQEFPTAAGLGDAPGERKDVQSCCSGHRAAVPLPQPLAAHEATARHDGGDHGVPPVPSCTPRRHAPKDRLELPWLWAQAQYRGFTPRPALCHGEPEQLLWWPWCHGKHCGLQHSPGMAPYGEPSPAPQPRRMAAPCHLRSASPAAAGEGSRGSGRKRRRRKAAAALGSCEALQQVWTPGSRGCSRNVANPSPAASSPHVPPTPVPDLPWHPRPDTAALPSTHHGQTPTQRHPSQGAFTLFPHAAWFHSRQRPTLRAPGSGSEALRPPAASRAVGLPALQREFNCNHHIRLPHPRPPGPPGSDGPGSSHLEGL